MNNEFPRILSLLRKEHGLTQKQVATDLDVAQALLSHYEKGKRELPLRHLITLCKFYDVSSDYILGFTNDPKPHWNIKNQVNITGKNKIHKIEIK